MDQSIVCTLFEGHYHYGVAALVNSLYKSGFRGDVYAGYRGVLPNWAMSGRQGVDKYGDRILYIEDNFRIIFVHLETDYHLTNYKPDFMLNILNRNKNEGISIFYFDPDIVICGPWWYFAEWVECGVALSEDVNSPIERYHPRRVAWRNFYNKHNVQLNFKNSIYVNGGFVGVHKKDVNFLAVWKNLQEIMAEKIGGLNRSALFNSIPLPEEASGDFSPFGKTDQDALNAAVEAYSGKISFGGKCTMGFENGLAILPHALGIPKPWDRNPILWALRGSIPRLVDKKYWAVMDGPISAFPVRRIKAMSRMIKIASVLGRFYKR